MMKYDGINKPEATLTSADEVQAAQKSAGSYLSGLALRIFVVIVLLIVAMGIKSADFAFAQKAAEAVKTSVSYDMLGRENDGEYLTDKIHALFSGLYSENDG